MLLEFEEGIRSPRAGVTGGDELPSMGAGEWARVICKSRLCFLQLSHLSSPFISLMMNDIEHSSSIGSPFACGLCLFSPFPHFQIRLNFSCGFFFFFAFFESLIYFDYQPGPVQSFVKGMCGGWVPTSVVLTRPQVKS